MPRPSNGALLQTGAISAATILGSGILGLPVSLSRAGLPPFLLSFTVTFFAQVGVVYMTTELLQRVHAARGKRAAAARAAQQEMLHYATGALAPRDADEISPRSDDVDRASGSGADGGDGLGSRSSSTFEDAPPGLHAFSELYLPHWTLKVLFETAVLFHFVSIMSSYALGAPQAFREVAPFLKAIPESVLVLAFTTLGAFVIVVFSDAVVAPLTFLTFIKGSLLTVMVLIVLFVGFGIGLHPSADWSISAGVESFLMGTLALSGVINLMPKLWDICIKSLPGYQGDVVDEKFVSYFRKAVNLALFVCYVLNCLWCIGVLLIVPQTVRIRVGSTEQLRLGGTDGSFYPLLFRQVATNTTAISLQNANALGQISTVPLVAALRERGSTGVAARLVVMLANVFVFISISVSFMVMGVGMTQMLDEIGDGLVESWDRRMAIRGRGSTLRIRTKKIIARYSLSAIFFSVVATISANNPKALLRIMAGITSLALNLEGGVLISIMFVVSRRLGRNSILTSDARLDEVPGDPDDIPLPVSKEFGKPLVAFIVAFFSFAVVVDLVKYIPTMFG